MSMSDTITKPVHQASKTIRGKYQNTIDTRMDMSPAKMFSVLWRMVRGVEDRAPKHLLPNVAFDAARFNADTQETLISWFGHSSLLVKFAGKNILFDPVFNPRASMFSFAGPKNFGYAHPMHVSKLPRIDMVVLSHDHYDHLDRGVIMDIHASVPQFYVPLGVGARLVKWGVDPAKVKEFDWWQKTDVGGLFELVCTPSRHFSGRGITDRNTTLWCSWVFIGREERFYFSGDSGYSPEFKTIGDTYGPFDFAFIECGQYNRDWEAIHMMPEQSVQAALDVRTALAIPIHWGKFALALHGWKEPVQRFIGEAEKRGLPYFFPQIGDAYAAKNITNVPPAWWSVL